MSMFNSLTQAITPEDYAKVVIPYKGLEYTVRLIGADKSKVTDNALVLRTGWEIASITPEPLDRNDWEYLANIASISAVPETRANKKFNPNGFGAIYSWMNNPKAKEETFRLIFRGILSGNDTPSSLTHIYSIERVVKALNLGMEEGYLSKDTENHYSLTHKGMVLATKGLK